MQNIQEIIQDNFAVVALRDGVLVMWNGSATFNIWEHGVGELWREVDVFTHYNINGFQDARDAGVRYLDALDAGDY